MNTINNNYARNLNRKDAIKHAELLEYYYKDKTTGRLKYAAINGSDIIYEEFEELVEYILEVTNKDNKLNFLLEYHL